MTTSPDAGVRVEREIPAPPDTVWAMFADASAFARWYGPPGATVEVIELDLSVGGRRFVRMRMDGPRGPMQMHLVGEHREIDPPKRLVYTEGPADAAGQVRTVPDSGRPISTTVIVELRPTDEGTALALTHAGVPAGSPGGTGWRAALDELARCLGDTFAPVEIRRRR